MPGAIHRFARTLISGRGLVVAAIVSAAIGLGPTLATLSLFDRLYLRPLPFAHPDRLVQVQLFVHAGDDTAQAFLPLEFAQSLRGRGDLFSGVAWVNGLTRVATRPGLGEPPLNVSQMTPNGLDVLGVRVVLGRSLAEDDAVNERDRALLLTYETWQARYRVHLTCSILPGAMGSGLYRVVGILPPRFLLPSSRLMDTIDGLFAFDVHRAPPRGALVTAPFARLRDGVSLSAANGALAAIDASHWQSADAPPVATRQTITAQPLRDGMGELVRPYLRALFLAAWVVLVVATLNIAVLMYAWTKARERTIGIKFALGASRRRILGATTAETLVVTATGSRFGGAVAPRRRERIGLDRAGQSTRVCGSHRRPAPVDRRRARLGD